MQQPTPKKSAFKTILVAWLIAGTLDICSAIIFFSPKKPAAILQYIAGAAFDKTAYSTTFLNIAGLLFHYFIALVFTVLLFILYPKIYSFIKNKFVIAIVYGIFVWCVMNLVIVPLSKTPPHSIKLSSALQNSAILMYAIGLPVALIVHNYYYGGKSDRLKSIDTR